MSEELREWDTVPDVEGWYMVTAKGLGFVVVWVDAGEDKVSVGSRIFRLPDIIKAGGRILGPIPNPFEEGNE